ncbi:hypothetical protein AB0T83_07800 [Fluviibacterium sp. DFM31]|uniref:Glycosyltransferase family 2 protein n=1 Tax=Meridianimarinicoccus marinus TaxID=3231483 RepID=A0ABV3L517_9RHOB
MQAPETLRLVGLTLPANSPALRDHMRPPERRTENYQQTYDRTTLFYDIVRRPERGDLLITAPPLMNLRPLLTDGLRDAQDAPLRLRIRDFDKYTQIRVAGMHDRLTFHGPSEVTEVRPRADDAPRFAGLNCAVTMNRNNPLPWVQAWALHHVREHRLEGVLIFDNGSTDYTPDDLARALALVPGLKSICVASAPYPYGTTDKVLKGETRPNFLQPAMLNLARGSFLRQARAVLNCDIDELVLSRDGSSVFDRAASKPWGAARLPVYWADPAPGTQGPSPQWAHRWRSPTRTRTPRKWCVAPRGLLSKMGWYVHHVGGEAFKLNRESTAHEIVHCRACSTGWHPFKARHKAAGELREDPELAALMDDLELQVKELGFAQ